LDQRAIKVCLDSELPEAALSLIYSGIDTVGLLDAPTKQLDADKKSFMKWAEHYMAPSLETIDGDKIRAIDLYSARCGILHVSSPLSKLARSGSAREIFYDFKASTGAHPLPRKEMPLVITLESLECAFRGGCNAFLTDIKADKGRFDRAVKRAVKWGVGSIMSDEQVDAHLAAKRAKTHCSGH
jgi:hypothetical protein